LQGNKTKVTSSRNKKLKFKNKETTTEMFLFLLSSNDRL